MRKIVSISLLTSISLFAEISATDVASKYTSKTSPVKYSAKPVQSIDFGFANTSGNTKTLNLNGKYSLSHIIENETYEPFRYNFQATAYVSKDNGKKTAQELTATLNGEQDFIDNWLGYVAIGWLRDEFKNYDNKFSFAVGIGKTLIDDGKQKLVLKLGPAYNIEQFSNDQADNKFGSINEYLEYSYIFNPYSNMYLKLGAMENFDDPKTDYESTALLGLDFALNEALHVSIEEELNYDNLPAIGFKKSDTKSIIRVGYKF